MGSEEIGVVIAALGVFFAMMAILAIMVEAIIGLLKLPGWSPVKGKPSPEDVLKEVSGWLPNDGTEEEGKVKALNKAIDAIGKEEIPLLENYDVAKVAETVGKLMTEHVQDEKTRRFTIKVLAITAGTILAVVFNINALEILGEILTMEKMPDWVGFFVSGIASSAGSHFWHDWSANLRQVKAAKEAVGV